MRSIIRTLNAVAIPISFILVAMVFLGCQNKEPKHYTENDESSFYHYMNYLIKDSVGHSPMTELITITDSLGHLYADAARASEGCDFDFVKYIKDSNGEVIGLDYFVISLDDFRTTDSISDKAKSLIFGNGQDEDYINRYRFERNGQGLITRVSDILNGEILKAPDGYFITYEVEEDSLFWKSCLDGGQLNIKFHLTR